MIIIDNREYSSESQKPDFGSIVCTGNEKIRDLKNNKVKDLREYEGLQADFDKLPTYKKYKTYADLATGSSFLALDTGSFYKYESTTDKWYKI